MQLRNYAMMSLALAVGLMNAANAQTMNRGSFELPSAVYCGNAVLEPGHYTIWFLHDGAPVQEVHLRGAGGDLSFPVVVRPGGNRAHSYLTLSEARGSYFIRALNAGSMGASLVFGVNKRIEREARVSHLKLAKVLPVSMAAGGY
jgi:hypothetical protein